jgi:predicted permease
VAIISSRLWRDYFGGRDDAIGKPLSMSGVANQVVGVMPDGFEDPIVHGVEIWVPIDMEAVRQESWRNNYLSAIARVRPEFSPAQARSDLAALVAAQQPHYGRFARSAVLVSLQTDILGSAAQLLWLLQGAVALLLLIACVNVASVFLARGAARRTELAVRRALGCSRRRLIAQFVIEGVMLAGAGAIAGLLLATTTSRALLASAPVVLPGHDGGVLDTSVLLFTCIVACAAALVFGIAPAVRFTRPDLDCVLREEGRGGSGTKRETRVRNVLVVCQVSLALVLTIGAGLLLRTFAALQSVDIGIQPDHVVTFEVNLPGTRYDPRARARFHEELESRIARMPRVRYAGAVSRLPLTGTFHNWNTEIAGTGIGIAEGAQQRVISGDYFAAMGIPLLRGRLFLPSDDERAPARVIVSRSLANRLFPSQDPLGRRLRTGSRDVEIIGVVGDVGTTYRAPAGPIVYHLHRQFADDRNWALVQVVALDGSSAGVLDEIRRELAAIDPALVLYRARTLRDAIGGGLAQERFAMFVVGLFAALAVTLAAIGLYGVLSYAVTRRQREIGIRLALGASPAAVRRLIVRDGAALAAIGVGLGIGGAAVGTRWMQALLYRTSATDPAIFAGAGVLLIAVALLASWIPGKTAQRIDPLEVFRRG